MTIINYVCSLRTSCHTTCWIKNMDFKKCSYPFDWIFASPEIVIDCLSDDFKTLLNKKYHIKHLTKQKGKSGHKKYDEKLFNHHDVLKKKDYNYFVRCVNRFHELSKKNESKLFIITFTNQYEDILDKEIENINKIYNLLKSYTNNFELLVVYHKLGNELKLNINNLNNNFKLFKIIKKKIITEKKMKNKYEDRFFNKSFKLYKFKILDDIH